MDLGVYLCLMFSVRNSVSETHGGVLRLQVINHSLILSSYHGYGKFLSN